MKRIYTVQLTGDLLEHVRDHIEECCELEDERQGILAALVPKRQKGFLDLYLDMKREEERISEKSVSASAWDHHQGRLKGWQQAIKFVEGYPEVSHESIDEPTLSVPLGNEENPQEKESQRAINEAERLMIEAQECVNTDSYKFLAFKQAADTYFNIARFYAEQGE